MLEKHGDSVYRLLARCASPWKSLLRLSSDTAGLRFDYLDLMKSSHADCWPEFSKGIMQPCVLVLT